MIPVFHRFENHIQHLQPASLRERIIAQLIDGVLLGIVCGVLYYFFSRGNIYSVWISPMFPVYSLQVTPGYLSESGDWWWGGYFFTINLYQSKMIHIGFPSLIFILLYGMYYSLFAHWYGQTPGKMMKKLVVLEKDRQQISPLLAIGRWLSYLISLLPLGVGFWYQTWNKDHQAMHDRICGTQVYSFHDK